MAMHDRPHFKGWHIDPPGPDGQISDHYFHTHGVHMSARKTNTSAPLKQNRDKAKRGPVGHFEVFRLVIILLFFPCEGLGP